LSRAIWSGSISFGLVNVPVKVFTAVREHSVHFHQVEKQTGARIRYEKVSDKSGEKVPGDNIELGYEIGRGRLVTVDPSQLADLRPRTSRTIDISDFVDLAQIDPVYYDHTYWLGPDGEGARRPYDLLARAMQDRNRAGIGMVVMRNKQYLAAIRPRDGVLAMSTMHFVDEVLDRSSVETLPAKRTKPASGELKLATQIIDALSTDWKPAGYKDTYSDEVKDLLERRAAGKHIAVGEEPGAEGQVLDLVAALEASLDAAKGPRASEGGGRRGRGTGATAQKRGRSTKQPAKSSRRKSA
jgi:DNA end-binding protein Ku